MVRLFALGGYFVQSLTALAAILAAGAILPASEYGAYSLAAATVQGFAILAFEWTRLAASRLLSVRGATGQADRLLASVRLAFGASALPLLLILPLAGLLLPGPAFSAVGALAAILLGCADLRLTLIRYRGDLVRSAVLQIVRSFLLLGGVVAGARLGTAETAFAGFAAGHAAAALAIALADGGGFRSGARASREELADLVRYGAPAALASGIHLLVPLTLRWGVSATTDPLRFAGIALAMDLFQRPFGIVLTALTGIFLPSAFHERDRSGGADAARNRLWLAHLYGGGAMLGLTLAVFPMVADLLVGAPLRSAFLAAAPAAILFFACHGWLQNSLPVDAMLARNGRALIRYAEIEAGLAAAAALGAWLAWGDGGLPVLWGAAAGAALSLAWGSRPVANALRLRLGKRAT